MMKKNIRIQFMDTDLSQRIHYSAIFKYFEMMDHEFVRYTGYSYNELFQSGYDMPRVNVECDYMGSIEYDDVLEVKTGISKVGNSSFTYLFQFFKGDKLVVRGNMTIVFVNGETGIKTDIPEYFKEKLMEHLELEKV